MTSHMPRMDRDTSRFKLLTGYFSGMLNCIFYGLGSASSQALEGAIPDCQLSIARYIGQFLVYLLVAKLTATSMCIPKQHVPNMVYSSVLALLYTIGFFGAIGHMPLIEAISVEMILAIISAIVQARVLFHKKIASLNIISFVVCTIGLMMAVQPSWLFKQNIQAPINDTIPRYNTFAAIMRNSSFEYSNMPALSVENSISLLKADKSVNMVFVYTLLILSGIADGMYYDVNAILLHEVPPIIKVIYLSGFGLLTSIVLAFYLEDFVITLTVKQLLLVLGHSVAAVVSFYTAVYTCQMIGGIRATLVFSLQTVVMLILQYTLMRSIMPGHHNWIEVLGAGFILFGAALQPVHDIVQNYHQADLLP